MNDCAQHLPDISAPLLVLNFPGRPGLVARKIMAIFVQAGLPHMANFVQACFP
jgi:hypothetical protein